MKVYEVLTWSQFLPKLAGAAPFGLSKTKIAFSRFGQVWSFLLAIIIISILWLWRDKLPIKLNGMKGILNALSFSLQFGVATFSVLKDGIYQSKMIEIVRSIEDYDKKIGYENDSSFAHENKRIRVWCFVRSIILVNFTFIRLAIFFIIPGTTESSIKLASELTVMIIDNSIDMFAVITTLLGMRFRYLNSIIDKENAINVRNANFASTSNPEYIRSLYTALVITGEKLNDHYSSRLFFWSARMIIEIITRIYNVPFEPTTVVSLLRITARLVPFVVALLVITIPCNFTVDQTNKTVKTLLAKNIRRTGQIDRGRKEIFTMCMYMALRPFAFSALGFFNVDLTLAYSTFTVSVTYIALCIQTRYG